VFSLSLVLIARNIFAKTIAVETEFALILRPKVITACAIQDSQQPTAQSEIIDCIMLFINNQFLL